MKTNFWREERNQRERLEYIGTDYRNIGNVGDMAEFRPRACFVFSVFTVVGEPDPPFPSTLPVIRELVSKPCD